MRISTIKRMSPLTLRDLSVIQRSVICRLSDGNKMYMTGSRIWLDCFYEAGVTWATFRALRRKGLIRLDRRTVRSCKQLQWALTEKGRLWARMPWRV